MSSRTNGALRGIWGSPQQAETGRFSLWRKSPGLPKGYHTALLANYNIDTCRYSCCLCSNEVMETEILFAKIILNGV